MKSLKTAVIPKAKEPSEKRIAKPLPLPPRSLSIDNAARMHISKLLNNWLYDLHIPIHPWTDVLFNIAIQIIEKSFNATNHAHNKIWMQTFSSNTPVESKFLLNVYHGKPVNEDVHSLDFPIGGTIRVYGLKNDEILTRNLTQLVESLVYVSYSIYLEAFVMRDSHVQIIQHDNVPLQEPKENTITTKPSNNHDQTSAQNGIFGWIKKLSPQYYYHSASTLSTPPPSVRSEKAITAKKRLSPLNTVLRRGISLNSLNKKVSPIEKIPGHDMKQGDPRRFLKLKEKVEHAVISSSPDCHFPYPILLNRLEIEEDMMLEQKRLLSVPAHYDDAIYPVTPLTENQPPIKQPKRQSSFMSFTQTFRQNSMFDNPTVDTLPLPQSITAYSSIRLPCLLADSKKGLEHLLLDTTSLESFMKHQSITVGFACYPIGCPDRPCLGPLMSKIDYFRYKSPENTMIIFPYIDQTLAHTIRHWCNQSQSPCQIHIEEQVQFIPGLLVESPAPNNSSRPDSLVSEHLAHSKASESSILTLASPLLSRSSTPSHRHCSKFHGCSQRLMDHVFSFSHGIGRINVYTSIENQCMVHNKNKIISWIMCSLCDAATTPISLNEETTSFSFGKYLELLFYNTKLSSVKSFCQHTQKKDADIKSLIIRCFMYNGIVIKFMYEDTKCYELRIPRIQLAAEPVPNNIISFTTPRISVVALNEWKHNIATMDINLFFQSVHVHLDLLNHYVKAENQRKIRGQKPDATGVKQLQTESRMFDNEMKALGKRLETDHQEILRTLSDTHINELNDFRRRFYIQSASIIDYLSDWQYMHCQEVTDTCGWDSPDYISKKNVHCFPGSSVLVREDEPTSIIAYTLSSNDYIQEILHNDGNQQDNNNTEDAFIPSISSTDLPKTNEPLPPLPANDVLTMNNHKKKPLPAINQATSSPLSVIDGYYSSIERKYISPSTGTSTETASFRTMVHEVVKSNVSLSSNSKRLENLKMRLSPWAQKQEEAKLEQSQGKNLKRQLTERALKSLVAVAHHQQEETKEIQVSSYFFGATLDQTTTNNGKNISPHIKHKFVHDNIEFTCIVYYAKEFEMLRRQCDINQLMIQSLSRCQQWTASGGKSKSCFYKTQDDRFIIKEMMNAWNVAEKDAFLKFAPKYFDHMKKSANEPSVLAKIFGFFTIRMKNAIDKKPILNLDVLVMEHLFYNQNIFKKFDFKGIQDRHLEDFRKQQMDTTLWDGDWLTEYRTRLSVNEQSKAIMELTIANDTEFLSKCNIMDYSLLVGIDQEKHEMTVGIVGNATSDFNKNNRTIFLNLTFSDFIGAYTWYKKLENRSKSTLLPRKEVTVVPPDQYKSRFCREVCDYFIPVPGKFDIVEPSKTLPSLLI